MKLKLFTILIVIHLFTIACLATVQDAPQNSPTLQATRTTQPTASDEDHRLARHPSPGSPPDSPSLGGTEGGFSCYQVTAEVAVHIRADHNAESQIIGHRAHGALLIPDDQFPKTGAPLWLHDVRGWSNAAYFQSVSCP